MSRPTATTPSSNASGLRLRGAASRTVFFVIFAISGFSGLIYESIWSHYLKLFLGHAAYAQSLVLIIFMGGLALGSWLIAKFSLQLRAPLLAYALVEGIIGVVALVFHDLFVNVSDAFYFAILPGIDSATLGTVLKWTAAAALIVPQSILLGMTFPLMTTGILRRYTVGQGGSLAMLYFTNSIGAAIGVLASGFWLIRLVGLPGTILTAGLLNIALALVVWVLVKLDPNPAAHPITPPAPEATARSKTDTLAVLFFVAAGITGAASFMYEVGWIRMLSLVLGATTHSFELMLSAFITGLAFGGLWIKQRIDKITDPVRFSGWVQVIMGVMALLTLPLYLQTFDWMAAILRSLQQSDLGYNLFTVLSHGITLLIMVPTTFLAGMTLPLFTRVLMAGRQGEHAIGRVYASNTLGAIVGVLFAVHIGMPLLGLENLIALAAALDILLGLVLLYRSASERRPQAVVQGAIVGATVLVFVTSTVSFDPLRLGSGVYRYRSAELDPETEVLFYRDGKTASINLVRNASRITIATNGKPDASIEMNPSAPPAIDEITMVMAAALPLAYKTDARRVANIGLGSGLTAHTLLGEPSIERVDTVEIERAMMIAAHGFGDHVARTFNDPRSVIHIEDAKTFFSQQDEPYDIIVAEPSNPWVSGVASLFSEEFYRAIRNYLTTDGVLVQWLQLYEFNDDLVVSVLKGLSRHFSDYAIYNTDDNNILIVAKAEGTLAEPEFGRFPDSTLEPELARVGLRNANDFLVRKTGSRLIIDGVIAESGIPANSDYFPFLDLNAGRARFREQRATLFSSWSLAPLPLLEMIGVADFSLGEVTPDRSSQRSMAIARARALHAALARTDGQADGSHRSSDTLATLLTVLRQSCAAGFEATWDEGLHSLARQTLQFLDPQAGAELLAAAVPPECTDSTTPSVRQWLALYGAIAARDALRMVQVGEGILRGPHNSADPARTRYALVAAMLGELSRRRPERVIELWNEHQNLAGNLGTSPDLRLILTLATNARNP